MDKLDSDPEPSSGLGPVSVAELYFVQYEAMLRMAVLLVGDQAVAEELVQESFARVHERWTQIEQPAAYLRTTVVNACRAHHRRAFRERSHYWERLPDVVSPETPMVLDAVARLPYRQRVALVLRFYEDRPDEEIAEILGCRPATVRSLIHRGLVALRKVITP